MPLNIAILASGSGSNAQAIFDKIAAGSLDAHVSLVVCNRPGAPVLQKAALAGVQTLSLDHTKYSNRESFDTIMARALHDISAELVVLAGYMRLLSPLFIRQFAGRIINVHPALLPSFVGAHGAADALAWGVRMSGCTVHFVEEEVDSGPIIAQGAVPVLPHDTPQCLQVRIQKIEHRLYPQVIQWFAEKRIRVHGRHVHLAPVAVPRDEARALENTHVSFNAEASSQEHAFFACPPLECGF